MKALWIVVALLALTGCPSDQPQSAPDPDPARKPTPAEKPTPLPTASKPGCSCECHTGDAEHITPCCGPKASDLAPAGTPIQPSKPNQYGCTCGCHSGKGIVHEAPCCGPDAQDAEQPPEKSKSEDRGKVPDGAGVPVQRNPDYKGDCGCECHHNPSVRHIQACCGPSSRD